MPAVTIDDFDAIYGVKEADLCNAALLRIGAELIRATEETTKQALLCKKAYAVTRDEMLRMYPAGFAVRSEYIGEDTAYLSRMGRFSRAYRVQDYTALPCAPGVLGATTLTATDPADASPVLVGRGLSGTGIASGTLILAANPTTGVIRIDRPTLAPVADVFFHLRVLKVIEVNRNKDSLYEISGGGEWQRIFTDIVSTQAAGEVNVLEIKFVDGVKDPELFDPMFYDALVLRIASKVGLPLGRDEAMVGRVQSEFSQIMAQAKKLASEERNFEESDDLWTDRRIGHGPSTN